MSTDVIIPETALVSQKQANAWIGLAQQKNMMAQALKNMELKAQSILLLANTDNYKAIDDALLAYRNHHTSMIETRKPLTQAIDAGIIQPLMEFEKRVDPKLNADYQGLTERSFNIRKAELQGVQEQNKKAGEIAAFKTHVENEFHRITNDYRWLLRNEARGQYEIALRERLNPVTVDIKKMMATLAPNPPAKFQPTLLTQEEMKTIYAGIPQPNYTQIFTEEMVAMDQLFSNFDSDVANAEAAIEFQKAADENRRLADEGRLASEQSMTTMIGKAETVRIEEPKIKKNLVIEIEETEAWARAVIAAFVINMPDLIQGKYIRVKSWSNLSLGQMAEYLGKFATETGIVYKNLKLKEVEK